MKTEIEKVETKEVVETENVQISLIEKALASGADLEKLERLFDLLLKKDAVEAKKAYVRAMAAFKENAPKITKGSAVDFNSSKGRTSYSYASLADITEKIIPALSAQGLSATWSIKQNGKVEVTCTMTHILSHSEQTSLSADADNSGNKNSIQAIGSTITYLQRYTLLAMCGLATFECDDDGCGADPVDCISDEQANVIADKIIDAGIDINKFCKYMKITDINELPLKKYDFAIKAIANAKNNKKEKK